MKAIILAAGEWSRLRPLTNTIPKPLIKIFGKSILEHNLEYICEHVDEIVIVVKYQKEKIIEALWDNYMWVKITYIEQSDEKWTGAAIRWIETDSDVLIMNWDSIFDRDDLEKLCKFSGYWVLVKKVKDPEKYWIFHLWNDGNIKQIVEKPKEFIGDLANLWVYKFDWKIIELAEQIQLSSRWEYEITDAINEFAKLFPFKAFEIQWEFIDVWYPWDVLSSNAHFLNKLSKSEINWTVEEWVTIKWNIVLEQWAVLKTWTYIEWNVFIWKNSIIWPNTYLRWNTVIWQDCKIWNAVEVKNSSIWDHTNIPHLSYIWDSVIWNNVNIWGGYITANLRHDSGNIKIPIKWELVDSGLHKFGVIIWDNTKTGIKCYSMPGRVVENNSMINPGTMIK